MSADGKRQDFQDIRGKSGKKEPVRVRGVPSGTSVSSRN